jgi:tRNA1(Val) A37 N6-methylase TrmN6
VLATNPELFKELFDQPQSDNLEDFEVEEIAPQTEEDVHRMLSQLKRQGVID